MEVLMVTVALLGEFGNIFCLSFGRIHVFMSFGAIGLHGLSNIRKDTINLTPPLRYTCLPFVACMVESGIERDVTCESHTLRFRIITGCREMNAASIQV